MVPHHPEQLLAITVVYNDRNVREAVTRVRRPRTANRDEITPSPELNQDGNGAESGIAKKH